MSAEGTGKARWKRKGGEVKVLLRVAVMAAGFALAAWVHAMLPDASGMSTMFMFYAMGALWASIAMGFI